MRMNEGIGAPINNVADQFRRSRCANSAQLEKAEDEEDE